MQPATHLVTVEKNGQQTRLPFTARIIAHVCLSNDPWQQVCVTNCIVSLGKLVRRRRRSLSLTCKLMHDLSVYRLGGESPAIVHCAPCTVHCALCTVVLAIHCRGASGGSPRVLQSQQRRRPSPPSAIRAGAADVTHNLLDGRRRLFSAFADGAPTRCGRHCRSGHTELHWVAHHWGSAHAAQHKNGKAAAHGTSRWRCAVLGHGG